MKSEQQLDVDELQTELSKRWTRHSDDVKTCAIELAELYSTSAAARMLGISTETVWEWRRRFASYTPSRTTKKHSTATFAAVLARAEEVGLPTAASEYGVPLQTAKRWRRLRLYGVEPNVQRRYSPAQKAAAVLDAGRMPLENAAKTHKVLPETLRNWMRQTGHVPTTRHKRHDVEDKRKALDLARELGPAVAALRTGIPEGTICIWLRSADGPQRSTRQYSEEERAYAVKLANELGSTEAARILGIPPSTLSSWNKSKEKRPPISHDREFTWLTGSAFDEWRQLAAEWVAIEPVGLAQRLEALRAFFKKYLIGLKLPTEVPVLLSRKTHLPDFYRTCCPKTGYGISCAHYTRKFIDWVLLARFSTPDERGRRVIDPAYHNPISHPARSSVPKPDQTVYSPLPMGYLEELQQILVQGPNFSDWKWAQSALHSEAQNQAPDWFAVADAQIDESDPDCVWRVRIRSRSSGGPIKEMWSPVRWVGILLKNIIPLRSTQVRVLDSGESDKWAPMRTPDGQWKWTENKHPLAGKNSVPQGMGVIRRSGNLMGGEDSLLLYANTNKTRDALLTGSKKGFDIAWPAGAPLHSDPFYWLFKLRSWQEKYNPVQRMTQWTELDGRHIHPKTDVQLATYASSCFLFRMRENAPDERHLPLTLDSLDPPWFALLSELERRLAQRGETLSDGSAIRLVVPGSSTQTYYPLHALRVSILSGLALDGKVPFPVLMRVAGHSRFLMTLYYTKIGEQYVRAELTAGLSRTANESGPSIINFLRQAERDQIVAELIANDPAAVSAVIPVHRESRNAAGWLPMHHGVCLVGGNTTPNPQGEKVGGCFNGGPNEGTEKHPFHGPVIGGARNCVSCRWFATEPFYLPALVAEFNNTAYHQSEAALRSMSKQREVNELLTLRAIADSNAAIFPEAEALKEKERQLEQLLAHLAVLSRKLADCLHLIERCIAQLRAGETSSSERALIANGSPQDVRVAIQDTDSELFQLVVVCQDAEKYPELEVGKAIVRLGQILDAAMLNEGLRPIFLAMSEPDQHRFAGHLMRRLSEEASPGNPSAGQLTVVSAMDGRRALSELGIDLPVVVQELELSMPAKQVSYTRQT